MADLLENESNPITFTCRATGEPLPTISWYFNSVLLNASNATDYNVSSLMNGTVVESLFTILDAQSSDVGTYTCHAENTFGSDTSFGILTINGKY